MIVWTDNSRKEFGSAEFVHYLYLIAEAYNLVIFYNNTAPHHGKYLHDGEGAVIKSFYYRAVKASLIKWLTQTGNFARSVVAYLNGLFFEMESKIARFACELPVGFEHKESNQKSIKGFTQHSCFVMNGRANAGTEWKNKVKYRRFSCYCKKCIKLEKCPYESVVGKWKTHKFKKIRTNEPDDEV